MYIIILIKLRIDRWLVPLPKDVIEKKNRFPIKKPHQFTAAYMKNNQVFLLYLSAYTIINFFLFVSRAIQYRESNGFVILARACGKMKENYFAGSPC